MPKLDESLREWVVEEFPGQFDTLNDNQRVSMVATCPEFGHTFTRTPRSHSLLKVYGAGKLKYVRKNPNA